jgi:putative redox protein
VGAPSLKSTGPAMTTQAFWDHASGASACAVSFNDGQTLAADLEPAVGGLGGPSPHDILDAALAACTTLTLQLYIARKGMAVQQLRVAVSHAKDGTQNVMTRVLQVTGTLTDEERASLLRVAEACPVHKTLTAGSAIVTQTQVQGP